MDVVDITKCALFDGMSEDEILLFLSRSDILTRRFIKNSVIIRSGDVCRSICVVLSGKAVGESVSDDGRVEEMAIFNAGDVFGDIIAMSESGESPVTVKATTDTEIVFIPITEVFAEKLLAANLAKTIAEKYFSLRFRLSCLSKPTIRAKIMEYLYHISDGKTGVVFKIPFTHTELADYLSSNRTAVTRELILLRESGVIDYYGKNYKINRMV